MHEVSRSWWPVRGVCLALLLAAGLAPEVRPALAAGSGKGVLVLDSTADMRTLFGSETKLLAVSNSIANTLPNFENRLDLGFLVYGHHSSDESACDKTVLRRPPAPLVSAEIIETLSELKAKGNAAVSRAVEVAAVKSGFLDTGGSIILLAGGADTCHADPCATAAKLADYQTIRVHVIGIDSGQEQASPDPLKCLADKTGGGYWRATSAIELTNALDAALTLAAGYRPELPGAPDTAGLAVGAAESPAAGTAPGSAGPTNVGDSGTILEGSIPVMLTALLTDAGPQIMQGLTWRVFEATRSPGGSYKLLATSDAPQPSLKFPSGRFFVNVSYGKANLTRRIDVAAAGGAEQFVLNAGALRLAVTRPDGSVVPENAISISVFSDEQDQSGDRKPVLSDVKPGAMLRLNAGIYHIVAHYGDANAVTEGEVGIEAGKLSDAALTVKGAMIGLKLVLQRGGEALADTSWAILSPDGHIIKESAGALPTHILAAGRYMIQAKRGVETFTQPLIVEAGQDKVVELLAASE